jgi:hypothetical protein
MASKRPRSQVDDDYDSGRAVVRPPTDPDQAQSESNESSQYDSQSQHSRQELSEPDSESRRAYESHDSADSSDVADNEGDFFQHDFDSDDDAGALAIGQQRQPVMIDRDVDSDASDDHIDLNMFYRLQRSFRTQLGTLVDFPRCIVLALNPMQLPITCCFIRRGLAHPHSDLAICTCIYLAVREWIRRAMLSGEEARDWLQVIQPRAAQLAAELNLSEEDHWRLLSEHFLDTVTPRCSFQAHFVISLTAYVHVLIIQSCTARFWFIPCRVQRPFLSCNI